jgi:hypothetical protein
MAKSAKLDSKAAINRIKIDSLPYSVYSGTQPIIPYGTDNLYPNRIINAIKKSPTASGCADLLAMFVQGEGLSFGGDMVVNRDGETFNDILGQSVSHYSKLNGFCLHFNFNVIGQITEIFCIDPKYVRKNKTLSQAQFGVWDNPSYYNGFVTVDLYNPETVKKRIREEGIRKYNGQLLYFASAYDIYPDSPLDSASISASFEKEVQVYQHASINNGFSASGVVKVPTMGQGEKADKNIEVAQENLNSMRGADKAGSFLAIPVPLDTDGKAQTMNLFESFTPQNIDALFVNQNTKAKENILTVYRMPEILLGLSSQGMFNEASYSDAFDYKNADTERNRKMIERVFQKVVDNSIFPVPEVEIVPLEMKKSQHENVNNEL